MPLPPKLNKFSTASPVIASFNFTDIVDGTGVIVLYPFVARDASGRIKIMDSRINATEVKGEGVDVSVSDAEKFNFDFDTKKFNATRTVEGTALLKLPMKVDRFTSSTVVTVVATITIFKWDGSTETQIGQTIFTRVTGLGGDFDSSNSMVELDLTRTVIPVGQQVRLNIVIRAQITSGSGDDTNLLIGHDPLGEDFVYIGDSETTTMTDSQMKLDLPFKLDI